MISSRFRSTLAGILVAVACGGESLRESDAGGAGAGDTGTGGTRVKPTPGSSGGDSTSGGRASAGEGSGGQASETGGQPSESTAGQAGEGTAGAGGEGGLDSLKLPPCPNPMVFEDPAVESSVRSQLGDGPIGPEEAATLTKLWVDLPRTTIDLRCFPSLDNVHIESEFDGLVDVTGLASLSNLKELTLYYATLENAELLAHLTNLESLALSTIMAKDVSFIWKLTALRRLATDGMRLDISKIGRLPELTDLRFISESGDLSALSQAKSLKKLAVSAVTDLGPLAQVKSLETLIVRQNHISDPTPIVALPNLKSVNFERCLLSDLAPLTQLSHHLDSLNLLYNPFDCEEQEANLAILRQKVDELISECLLEP